MPKPTQKSIQTFLDKNPLEDRLTQKQIEKLLTKKRGYITRIPKAGDHVILLLSGGLDSITTWAMLMDTYKLIVHPVCIKTGQKRHAQEIKSVSFFSKIFKRKYPKQFISPFHITFPTSAPEISSLMRNNLHKTIHPDMLSKNFDKRTNTITLKRTYLFPAFFPFPAAIAALFFDLHLNQSIRTIFCSILPTDGLYNASQTLTSLRATTLALGTFTNDYSWQVISLCLEPEANLFLQKSNLIAWADAHELPIHRAYTCFKGGRYHCGTCLACAVRKEQFQKAGVHDATVYENTKFAESIRKTIKDAIKPLLLQIKARLPYQFRAPKISIKDYH